MNFKLLFSLFTSGLLILSSCKQSPNNESKNSTKPDSLYQKIEQEDKITTIDTFSDDYASVISGLITNKYYKDITTQKKWLELKTKIDKDWEKVNNRKIKPVRKWIKETSKIKSDSHNLFYPFAGADFLYANTFFKDAMNIILVGLEPVGTILNKNAKQEEVNTHISKTFNALYFSNNLGFFRTKSMARQLNEKSLNGTLPLILFYCKRLKYQISDIKYFTIDSVGKQIYKRENQKFAVQVDICDSSKLIKKSIYYFSLDLSNSNLSKDKSFLKFVSKFDNKITFLKAASYLMHKPPFTIIRDYILESSKFVFEDATGIPYRKFDRNKWKISFYGKYKNPIHLFRNYYQLDLKTAYDSVGQHQLPFGIGYNQSTGQTNFIMAEKK